jgi:hypothetical protein
MVNYQLGKIYKIVCRITGEVYVGSTCEKTLARRLVAHRSACNRYIENQEGSKFSSFQIIQRGDYYIELLENYPCNNSDELRKKEREWYDKTDCINHCRPYLFKEEMRVERLIYDEINKERIREKQKQYVEEHKERINEYKRLNYHKNKKEPTEEEIEAKRLRQEIRIKNMRDKLYEKRAKIRENPNYEEEKKQRQLELHRIANKKYNDKKKEAKKQSHT